MRRLTITFTAAVLLLGIAPASALARHHHRRHHSRVQHARVERFGRDHTSSPTTSGSADNAGTVESFSGGVLTLKLGDGSMVSGRVTDATELECMAPETSQTVGEDGSGDGGDQSSGDGGDHSSGDGQSQSGGDQGDIAGQDNQAEDQNENEAADDNENENEAENHCSTANLTSGTVVHEATLRISSTGSVWTKLELES